MLIDEGDLTPAAFSLSVFNTPPALAASALNLTAGYTAVYPGGDTFASGLKTAAAVLEGGAASAALLVYADELCPAEYGDLAPAENEPFAFAALLTGRDGAGAASGAVPASGDAMPAAVPFQNDTPVTPAGFLKNCIRSFCEGDRSL
jgi:hypothetical protein